jgi:hypothetical protein
MTLRELALVALALGACGRTPAPALTVAGGEDASERPDAGDPAEVAPPPAATVAVLPAESRWRACGALAAAITALASAPDGELLAVGYADGRLTLLRRGDGALVGRLQSGAGPVDRMVFSGDGHLVATLGGGVARIFRVADTAPVRALATGAGAGVSLQFSPGPRPLLLAASEPLGTADNVAVWQVEDGARIGSLIAPAAAVFADNGRALLVDDGSRRLASLSFTGRVLGRAALRPVPDRVLLSPDGALAAGMLGTGLDAQRWALYSARDGRLLVSTPPVRDAGAAHFLPGGRLLALTSAGRLFLAAPAGTAATTPAAAPEPVAVSPDGEALIGVDDDGRLVETATPDGARRPFGPDELGIQEAALGLAVSRDGRYLAAAGIRDRAFVFALAGGALVHVFATAVGFKPAFSPDGTLFALGGDGRSLFRMSDGAEVTTIEPPPGLSLPYPFPGLTFSADGQILASGEEGRVALYGLDGRALGSRPSHAFAPGVAFSADGAWMATSGPELWRAGTEVRIWPEQIEPAVPSADPGGADDTVAFSPDGTLVLVSHAFLGPPERARSTRLLRVSDGALVRDYGDTLARRPSFSPDGRWIAAGPELLSLATGTRQRLDDLTVSLFLPDGRIAGAGALALRLFCPGPP